MAVWLLLLTAPGWAATMGSIAKDRVNIRSGPSMKAKPIFQAQLGYPVRQENRRHRWAYIRDWKGRRGWVYQPLVSRVRTVIVLPPQAKIRQGPAARTPVEGEAYRGEIYKIFGTKGKWVKIGYYLENEVRGWIHRDLVWGDR